jgi:hypothetical protein
MDSASSTNQLTIRGLMKFIAVMAIELAVLRTMPAAVFLLPALLASLLALTAGWKAASITGSIVAAATITPLGVPIFLVLHYGGHSNHSLVCLLWLAVVIPSCAAAGALAGFVQEVAVWALWSVPGWWHRQLGRATASSISSPRSPVPHETST